MKDELLKLGFTSRQADIYLALLSMGETSIGPLERKLRLHRQLIYNAIEELKDRDLVKVLPRGNRRYFSAADPENILENIRGKMSLAKTIIPKLSQQRAVIKHAHEIEIFEGTDGVQKFFRLVLQKFPKDSTAYIIGGGASKFMKITSKGNFFRQYENMRLRRGIRHKILLYENQKRDPDIDLYTSKRDLVDYRFLPDEFDQPLATGIWSDRISLFIFGDEPMIISLEGKKLVDTYKNYFKLLWSIGK